MSNPINRTERVELKSGWLKLGESQGRAVDRVIERMNEDGYRLVFITEDRWSFGKKLGTFLLFCISFGFRGRKPSVLIVGERIIED